MSYDRMQLTASKDVEAPSYQSIVVLLRDATAAANDGQVLFDIQHTTCVTANKYEKSNEIKNTRKVKASDVDS